VQYRVNGRYPSKVLRKHSSLAAVHSLYLPLFNHSEERVIRMKADLEPCQIFMSVAREARPTIRFVDDCCQLFARLFPEVRSFEAFKLLHLGMISESKHKSLPAIAKAVGLNNP
jgi:hypothetical protein